MQTYVFVRPAASHAHKPNQLTCTSTLATSVAVLTLPTCPLEPYSPNLHPSDEAEPDAIDLWQRREAARIRWVAGGGG